MQSNAVQVQKVAKFLERHEVISVAKAAKRGRYPHRDFTLIITMFYHGLRCSEAISMRWSQIDFKTSNMLVVRSKKGEATNQPIRGSELRALRELRRQWPDSAYVFPSERGAPLSRRSVHHIIEQAGREAGIDDMHPHRLRHACGYWLANEGCDTRMIQGYLGHRSIHSTVRYTALSSKRFESLPWFDI